MKPFSQMNRNLAGSTYGRLCIKFPQSGGFRGEDFLEINQSETRMACGGHVF
jgi:hypothetical protein